MSRTKSAPGPLDVLTAMLNDEADNFRVTLPIAERLLPALLTQGAGLNCCAIEEAAERLLTEASRGTDASWPKTLAKWDALQQRLPTDDAQTLSVVRYSTAEGAFALGLVAGMRIGGGR
jgi:hypothetical protein